MLYTACTVGVICLYIDELGGVRWAFCWRSDTVYCL